MFWPFRRKRGGQPDPADRAPPVQAHVSEPPRPGTIRDVLGRVEIHIRESEAATDRKIHMIAEEVIAEVRRGLDRQREDLLAAISQDLCEAQRQLTAEITRDTHACLATLEDRLSDQCGTVRQQAIQKPIIEAVVALVDHICAEREYLDTSYRRNPELAANLDCRQLHEQSQAAIASLAQEALAILRGLDVVPIQGTSGKFDSRHQQVVSVEPTSDSRLDGHVSKILRPGYEWRGKVLRPEQVVVYKSDKET